MNHELCLRGMLQWFDSRSRVYSWECLISENRKYKVQKFNIIKKSDFGELDTKFTTKVFVNIYEPSEVNKFLDDFFEQSSTTFNKDMAHILNTDAKVQKCKVWLGGSWKTNCNIITSI